VWSAAYPRRLSQTLARLEVTLRFKRTTDATCADKVVSPKMASKRNLPQSGVDVEVPTAKPAPWAFVRAMGMFKSAVLIRYG